MLQNREPHVQNSALIWKLCETEQAEGYVSALSFADLVYVMRKEPSPAAVDEVRRKLGLIFRFTELSVADITKAAEMERDDYEDAVQAVTAERLRADMIITRNARDSKKSKVPAYTPAECLARI